MILPPAIAIAIAVFPALPAVHDAAELLTYQAPQSLVQSNRAALSAAADVALSVASELGLDLDGSTLCDEVL